MSRHRSSPAAGLAGWTGLTAALAGLAGLAGWHLGPAATWLPPVRRYLPGLSGRGRPDHVALTFDDGPGPDSTPAVLAVLEAADVRATFFVLGAQLARHPAAGQAVVAAGHEVGVHGWEHRYLLGRPFPRVHHELARARDLVTDLTGAPPTWFRPTYGVLTGDAVLAARLLGMRPVLWTAWGRDWTSSATAESVTRTLAPGIRGGATLLLHDADHATAPAAWRATLQALPEVIRRARALGLTLGPLREHGIHEPGIRPPGSSSGPGRRRSP